MIRKTLSRPPQLILLLMALIMPFSMAGCMNDTKKAELTIFAASSLTNAFEEIGNQFEDANPETDIIYNFGSSSQLAAQILAGVPGDIFASANETQMEIVQKQGFVASQIRLFGTNTLVIGVPKNNPFKITQLLDLATPGLRVILASPQTPIREYSNWVINNSLQEEDQIKLFANLVSEEANVRQVVTKIALGEADAGLIYSSDITPDLSTLIEAVPIPQENNITARYPVGILTTSRAQETAEKFIQYLLSAEGQAILQKWGFGPKP